MTSKPPVPTTTTSQATDRRVPGYSITAWAIAVLIGLGAPTTPANISALVTWANHESGGYNPSVAGGRYNPLNTTQPGFNASGQGGSQGNIKDYPTFQDGVNAIVHNLLNPNFGYPAIVSALRQGNNPQGVFAAVDASAFGTHGLSGSSLQTGGIGGGGAPGSGASGGGQTAQTTGIVGDVVGGIVGGVLGPAGSVFNALTGGALKSVTAPFAFFISLSKNWRYFVEIGAGLLLVGVAIFLLGKHTLEERVQEVGPAAAAAAAA